MAQEQSDKLEQLRDCGLIEPECRKMGYCNGHGSPKPQKDEINSYVKEYIDSIRKFQSDEDLAIIIDKIYGDGWEDGADTHDAEVDFEARIDELSKLVATSNIKERIEELRKELKSIQETK